MQGIRVIFKTSLIPRLIKQPIREASVSPSIQIDVHERTGFATLSLNRPPANILNLEMLQALNVSLKEVEQNKCRGLILTSTSKTVFCAGLDIKELFKPDQERLREFWSAFQDSWLALFGSSAPSAALINGHSPAGGCVYSTCCEYRVMLPNFTIGLNEAQFGLVAPKFIRASFSNVLPTRIAEMALIQGKMFSSDEALQSGLVDELTANKEEAHGKCEKFLSTFANVDPMARTFTKRLIRSQDLNDLHVEKKQDLEDFVKLVIDDDMQERLGVYLNKLQQKRKNK